MHKQSNQGLLHVVLSMMSSKILHCKSSSLAVTGAWVTVARSLLTRKRSQLKFIVGTPGHCHIVPGSKARSRRTPSYGFEPWGKIRLQAQVMYSAIVFSFFPTLLIHVVMDRYKDDLY